MSSKLLSIAIVAALAFVSTRGFSAGPFDAIEARAEAGDRGAQVEVGRAYLEGTSVPRDTEKGVEWLARATEGPDADAAAALVLAEHYERAAATPANFAKQVQYLRRAAVLGHTTAQTKLGLMLLTSATDARLSPSSQEQAKEKGRLMLEHASAAGNAAAATALAGAYRTGLGGIAVDGARADALGLRAADLGDHDAAMAAADRLLREGATPADTALGVRYLRMAAAGNVQAMSELARRLADGDGVPQDAREAAQWADRAAERGDTAAASLRARLRYAAARTAATEDAARAAPVAAVAVAVSPVSAGPGPTAEVPLEIPVASTPAPAPQPPRAELAFDAGDAAPIDTLSGKTYDDLLQDVGRLESAMSTQQTELAALRAKIEQQQATIGALTAERDNALAVVRSIERTLDRPDSAPASTPVKPGRAPSSPRAEAIAADAGESDNAKGLAALRQGNASDAIEHFTRASKANHAGAYNNLGMLVMQGRGAKPDIGQAIEYFARAAELGNGVAANNLGFIYLTGRGVTADRGQAIAWYQRAASLGNQAGDRQLRALGVARDPSIAAVN